MHFLYGYHTIWPMLFMGMLWLILIIIGILLVRSFVKGAPKSNKDFKERVEIDKE